MKSTANRTRPKIMNAGIAGLTESVRGAFVAGGVWMVRPRFSNAQITTPVRRLRAISAPSSEQARLLPSGALLGFDGRHRRHVQYAARGHGRGEDMRGT